MKIAKTKEIGDEGYLIKVTPASAIITANTKAGIVYGMQTLFQTLPAIRTNAVLQIPAMEVKDYPRFKWRGMHLDVSRHFFFARARERLHRLDVTLQIQYLSLASN